MSSVLKVKIPWSAVAIAVLGVFLISEGSYRLYLTHSQGFIEVFLGFYAVCSYPLRRRKQREWHYKIKESLQRMNSALSVTRELRFKGRLTKEDQIAIQSHFFLTSRLCQTRTALLIVLGIISLTIGLGALLGRYTALNISQAWAFSYGVMIILLLFRNRIILFFYERHLAGVTQSQEVDTEVIFGLEEVTVKSGSNPVQAYPSSTVSYTRFPYGLFFNLNNKSVIHLPNRILTPQDIAEFEKMYVNIVDKHIIERARRQGLIEECVSP